MRVETYGLDEFAADLGRAGDEVVDRIERVTAVALNNMKKDAQQRVRGYPHIRHLPRSFNYDVDSLAGVINGEVGADRSKRQGKLDAYIEDGTPTSAPIPHWRPAADKEIPVWHRYVDEVAAEVIEKRGGR